MELLVRRARELGLHLSPEQVEGFRQYYRELVDWNRRVNLTAIVDCREVQRLHFLDSLTIAPLLSPEVSEGGRVIDLGSGGGFPGIPLKMVYPGLHLTLVDSVGKKTAVLGLLARSLGLRGVEVVTGRAEELAHRPGLRESFDLVLARALAPLAILAELAIPFCRLGGIVVAQKKGRVQQEVAQGQAAIEEMGGRLRQVAPVEVTGLRDGRALVVIEKVDPTPPRYPRRPGIPQKRPIQRLQKGAE